MPEISPPHPTSELDFHHLVSRARGNFNLSLEKIKVDPSRAGRSIQEDVFVALLKQSVVAFKDFYDDLDVIYGTDLVNHLALEMIESILKTVRANYNNLSSHQITEIQNELEATHEALKAESRDRRSELLTALLNANVNGAIHGGPYTVGENSSARIVEAVHANRSTIELQGLSIIASLNVRIEQIKSERVNDDEEREGHEQLRGFIVQYIKVVSDKEASDAKIAETTNWFSNKIKKYWETNSDTILDKMAELGVKAVDAGLKVVTIASCVGICRLAGIVLDGASFVGLTGAVFGLSNIKKK